MNFIETQQKEAQLLLVLHMLSGELGGNAGDYQLSPQDLDRTIKITITNTLNHILESGLLEERKKYPPDAFLEHRNEFNSGHNTLARAIKELISNMWG